VHDRWDNAVEADKSHGWPTAANHEAASQFFGSTEVSSSEVGFTCKFWSKASATVDDSAAETHRTPTGSERCTLSQLAEISSCSCRLSAPLVGDRWGHIEEVSGGPGGAPLTAAASARDVIAKHSG